jgi:hypothetical protein
MSFGRDHLASRHRIALEAINLPPPHSLSDSLEYEKKGNWFLAGECYSELEQASASLIDVESRARLLARTATCLEIASVPHSSARAYNDAGRLLSQNKIRPQDAAELFNRAALQFRKAEQFFFAGSAWRSAAGEFEKLGNALIDSRDNISPMPMSAAALTCAGNFFHAAGAVFELADSNKMWSCMAYWEAAKCYSVAYPSPNIQTFNSYVDALVACIRYYGSLELEVLRRSLPLSEEERSQKLNPLAVLEESAFRTSHHHQPPLNVRKRNAAAKLETDRYLAGAFHRFSTELLEIGNGREAAIFRTQEKERWRRVYFGEGRLGKAALYSLWNLTSGYGESLLRWGASCAVALAIFSFLYFYFDAISPVASKIDYVYFSVITFTSLGYGDIHPEGIAGKILACTEIMLGLVMFGVLLSFLGNRFQRS